MSFLSVNNCPPLASVGVRGGGIEYRAVKESKICARILLAFCARAAGGRDYVRLHAVCLQKTKVLAFMTVFIKVDFFPFFSFLVRDCLLSVALSKH